MPRDKLPMAFLSGVSYLPPPRSHTGLMETTLNISRLLAGCSGRGNNSFKVL